jgi:hyaluronate lyase
MQRWGVRYEPHENGNSHWSSFNQAATRTALRTDARSATESSHPSTSFSRLRELALAYATAGSPLRGNAARRNELLAGLDWR